MRRTTYVIMSTVILLLVTGCKRNAADSDKQPEVDSVALLVSQIQRCSRLYVAEAHVRKILTSEDNKHFSTTVLDKKLDFEIPMSSRKIAVPIDGTVKAYIDFSGFSEKNVIRKGDKIEIVLPDPRFMLTSTRIDHNGVHKQIDFIRKDYTDSELTEINQNARKAIIKDIANIGLVDMARTNSANILIPIIRLVGFRQENITVVFRKEFKSNEMSVLIDNKNKN